LKRSEAGVERAKRRGGLHKRSAEAWGHPLRARGAELPLAAVGVVLALQMIRAGVAGRNRPAEVGGGGRRSRPETGRRLLPSAEKLTKVLQVKPISP
jgi:hypothetical protein